MKNLLILTFLTLTIVLGAVGIVQWRKNSAQRVLVSSLRAGMEEKSAQVAELQTAQKRSGQQRRELLRQADELAAQLEARQGAETQAVALMLTNPPPAAGTETPDEDKGGVAGFGKLLSQMMKDPEAKKLIRQQQMMMTDQLYAPLVKQMGLTPEEADQFKGLLTDNMVKGAENAFSMFDGAASTNRAQTLERLTAEQKTFDEQVKNLLGDARYAQYADYQKTVGERTQLNLFKQQTAGSDHPLTDQQTEQLLAMMGEERQGVAATTALPPGATADPAKFMATLSEENVGEMLHSLEALSQRVYERARTVLYPDQLEAFGRFQTNQVQTMRMGMNMARKFFGSDKAEDGSATPNQ